MSAKTIVQLAHFCLVLGENISPLGNRTSSYVVPRVVGMGNTNYPSGSLGTVINGATLVCMSLHGPRCSTNWHHIKIMDLEYTYYAFWRIKFNINSITSAIPSKGYSIGSAPFVWFGR